jgi:D-alanine-D-alanine ligase
MARVLLLFGGRSAEHEVSCSSAVSVLEALRAVGHRVVPVGIDRNGAWYLADPTRRPMVADGRPVRLGVPDGVLRVGQDEVGFDVAFPILHGPFGEDGTIQGLFETVGKPYVGCGVLPSALVMDKDLTKRLVRLAGVATPDWMVVGRDEFREDPHGSVAGVVAELGLDVFVKPAALGSSVGISRAGSEAEVKEAIEQALRYGEKVIVEEAISGREIEVAMLSGPRSSLPGEVFSAGEWYDYESKYHDESSRFEAPANLSDGRIAEVRELAARAFGVLECRGLARIDFFYEQGRRGFLFNEANTMPGFTPISGFPKMWLATGMSYSELCDELVSLALGD